MSSTVIKQWKCYSQVHGFQTVPQNSLVRWETSAWEHLLGCRWAADQHQLGGTQLEQSVAKPRQQWPLAGEGGHAEHPGMWNQASRPSAAHPARRQAIWRSQQSSSRRWLGGRRWFGVVFWFAFGSNLPCSTGLTFSKLTVSERHFIEVMVTVLLKTLCKRCFLDQVVITRHKWISPLPALLQTSATCQGSTRLIFYYKHFLNPYPTSPWLWHGTSLIIQTVGDTGSIKVFCELLYKFIACLRMSFALDLYRYLYIYREREKDNI